MLVCIWIIISILLKSFGKNYIFLCYYTFQFDTKLCTKCVTGINWYQVSVI